MSRKNIKRIAAETMVKHHDLVRISPDIVRGLVSELVNHIFANIYDLPFEFSKREDVRYSADIYRIQFTLISEMKLQELLSEISMKKKYIEELEMALDRAEGFIDKLLTNGL